MYLTCFLSTRLASAKQVKSLVTDGIMTLIPTFRFLPIKTIEVEEILYRSNINRIDQPTNTITILQENIFEAVRRDQILQLDDK